MSSLSQQSTTARLWLTPETLLSVRQERTNRQVDTDCAPATTPLHSPNPNLLATIHHPRNSPPLRSAGHASETGGVGGTTRFSRTLRSFSRYTSLLRPPLRRFLPGTTTLWLPQNLTSCSPAEKPRFIDTAQAAARNRLRCHAADPSSTLLSVTCFLSSHRNVSTTWHIISGPMLPRDHLCCASLREASLQNQPGLRGARFILPPCSTAYYSCTPVATSG